MNKLKIVFFSDLHYAPVPPVNNGSKIERKLTDLSLPILSKLIFSNKEKALLTLYIYKSPFFLWIIVQKNMF